MSQTAVNLFNKQLNLISNDKIRSFVEFALRALPDYFEHIPASSSGKYHPAYALGEGGLVRHTKAAVVFAQDIFVCCEQDFSQGDKDIIIGALILHDGLKRGDSADYTIFEHPKLMAEYCQKLLALNNDMFHEAREELNVMIQCIHTHMGKWNTSPKSEIVLPLPVTKLEKTVHMCDYLASRKYYEVNLGGAD